MANRTHKFIIPPIKPLPIAPTVPINGGYQTSHMDIVTARKNSNQPSSKVAGNSGKGNKTLDNPKKVLRPKVAKYSKKKSDVSSVKGRKKASTAQDKAKVSKRKQQATESVDLKKQKTEDATPENENTTLEEETEKETIHEQPATISVEQDETIGMNVEDMVIADLNDASNQQNEENVQISPGTIDNVNLQAKENASEAVDLYSNYAKSTEEPVSKEREVIGEKMAQKNSMDKSAKKPKETKPRKQTCKEAKAPKKPQTLPTTKRQKANLKMKELGQKRKK